jgi:hypothetical protein
LLAITARLRPRRKKASGGGDRGRPCRQRRRLHNPLRAHDTSGLSIRRRRQRCATASSETIGSGKVTRPTCSRVCWTLPQETSRRPSRAPQPWRGLECAAALPSLSLSSGDPHVVPLLETSTGRGATAKTWRRWKISRAASSSWSLRCVLSSSAAATRSPFGIGTCRRRPLMSAPHRRGHASTRAGTRSSTRPCMVSGRGGGGRRARRPRRPLPLAQLLKAGRWAGPWGIIASTGFVRHDCSAGDGLKEGIREDVVLGLRCRWGGGGSERPHFSFLSSPARARVLAPKPAALAASE